MEAQKELDNLNVRAVLGINEEEVNKFSNKYGIEKKYVDYDELLANDEIDFVYIGLPNHLHFSYAKKALERKKSVIVEKPFVPTVEEVDILLEIAKENKMMIFDAITTKYNPLINTIENSLKEVGNIKNVTSIYCQYSKRYDQVRQGIIPSVFDLKENGGCLNDLGIYPVMFNVALFGKPQNVKYYSNKLENGCDTSGVAILQYPKFISTIRIAKDSFTENRCTIEGDDGSIFVDDDCFRFPNVRLRKNKSDQGKELEKFEDDIIANEFKFFVNTYLNKDFDLCYKKIVQTRDVIDIMKKLAESDEIYYN